MKFIPVVINMDKVKVVSLKSYFENNKRKHKKVSLSSITYELKENFNHNKRDPKFLVTSESKYEVLDRKNRRIYFDIEKIPVDEPDLIYEIMDKINEFFKKKDSENESIMQDDMKFVLTFNSGSKNHDGLSYHLICHNYYMNYDTLKYLVIEFVNTDGIDYKDYIDIAVYSKIRLFKLPYFIGIDSSTGNLDENKDNFHRIVINEKLKDTFNFDNYIIQLEYGTKINIEKINKYPNKAKRISGPEYAGVKNILKETMDIILSYGNNVTSRHYSMDDIEKEVRKLKQMSDEFGAITKKKVDSMYEAFKNKKVDPAELPIYKSLIDMIHSKYSNIIERLKCEDGEDHQPIDN